MIDEPTFRIRKTNTWKPFRIEEKKYFFEMLYWREIDWRVTFAAAEGTLRRIIEKRKVPTITYYTKFGGRY